MNLIAKAGFRHFDECISKIREVIAWINSSNQRVDDLKRLFLFNGLDEKTIYTDNRIRWNSNFLMLNSFLTDRYVDVTHEYVNRNGDHDITEADIAVPVFYSFFLRFFMMKHVQCSPFTHPHLI